MESDVLATSALQLVSACHQLLQQRQQQQQQRTSRGSPNENSTSSSGNGSGSSSSSSSLPTGQAQQQAAAAAAATPAEKESPSWKLPGWDEYVSTVAIEAGAESGSSTTTPAEQL
jgi:hypothetical protein